MTEVMGARSAAPARTPEVPARVGVVGGGRMGAGIAHAFVLAGAGVTVVERDGRSARGALDTVRRGVDKSAALGVLDEAPAAYLTQLAVTVDVGALAGCELVVEAVPEDLALKVDTLRRVEKVVGADTPLATNTSSLSVTAIARGLGRPGRVLGLHFFNPVPASDLVEVVVGEATSPSLTDDAVTWVRALRKTPIVVKDSPGFASSRLGVAIALEAMRMVEDGVASPEDIDQAMVLGYRHHTGPLRTTDLVGLDVRLGIAEYLHSAVGDAFAPPQILRDKVAAGHLGRKSGQGFFTW
jgi:3-hydroxybutyryl-CoA dehydrogenase